MPVTGGGAGLGSPVLAEGSGDGAALTRGVLHVRSVERLAWATANGCRLERADHAGRGSGGTRSRPLASHVEELYARAARGGTLRCCGGRGSEKTCGGAAAGGHLGPSDASTRAMYHIKDAYQVC